MPVKEAVTGPGLGSTIDHATVEENDDRLCET